MVTPLVTLVRSPGTKKFVLFSNLLGLLAFANGHTYNCTISNEYCVPATWCQARSSNSTGKQPPEYCGAKVPESSKRVCCAENKIVCQTLNGTTGLCESYFEAMDEMTPPDLAARFCYVKNQRRYYCDTEPKRNRFTTKKPQLPSEFRICQVVAGNGIQQGYTVDRELCWGQLFKQTGDRVCCIPVSNNSQLIEHPKAAKLMTFECGRFRSLQDENSAISINNGYPWMAMLLTADNELLGSGSLIHPRYVLTAFHCLDDRLELVSLRRYAQGQNPTEEMFYGIQKKIAHPSRHIGMLQLNQEVDLVKFAIEPICLPVCVNTLMRKPIKMSTVGWRDNENDDAERILQRVEVTVDDTCKGRFLPAQTHNKTTHCAGDLGGPYQVVEIWGAGHRYTQFGIVSRGRYYCSNVGRPCAGELIGYYIDWILDQMDI